MLSIIVDDVKDVSMTGLGQDLQIDYNFHVRLNIAVRFNILLLERPTVHFPHVVETRCCCF